MHLTVATRGGALRATPKRALRAAQNRLPRTPGTRAQRLPSRRGPIAVAAVLLALSVLLLVLLAYAVGNPSERGESFGDSVVTATASDGTAVVLALAILTLASWCFRRLWLERLAWLPGRIEVASFAYDGNGDADAVHLTALFRQRLATLRLQSPTPVPGSAPEGEFIDVLGRNGAGGAVGMLLGLLRAAKPSHAYEINGVLVKRDQAPHFGVTVQVLRRPDQGAAPDTTYDVSWERAVRRAADRALAEIVPRTRHCAPPWAAWRGFAMPPDLIEAYEDAVELETGREYERALDRFYDALDEDPMNLVLRLHIGQLQEKLGLYLDALATYAGMVEVTTRREDLPAGFYRRAADKEREEALVIGRYRRVVLLGGPALAKQWCETGPKRGRWTERDLQRESLRDRLRGGLLRGLSETAQRHHACAEPPRFGRTEVEKLLAEPEHGSACGSYDPALLELRELFALRALDDLSAVGATEGGPLTKTGLALTKRSIELRRKWIVAQQKPGAERWIWTPECIAKLLSDVKAHRLDRWHEHYNAACALALPLLIERRRDAAHDFQRNDLAAAAVHHLECATACADSAYIATRRDWLIAEDPDLSGLRAHRSFKTFEAMYFPAGRPTLRRPRSVQKLESAIYVRDLLDATCARLAEVWHQRRRDVRRGVPDVRTLIEWWELEQEMWHGVGRVAFHGRHWRARLELLQLLDRLAATGGRPPVVVPHQRYEDNPLAATLQNDPDKLAGQAIRRLDRRLRQLASRLTTNGNGGYGIGEIDAWLDALRDEDGAGGRAPAARVRKLCDAHADAWERLRQHLACIAEANAAGPECFLAAQDRLAELLATPLR